MFELIRLEGIDSHHFASNPKHCCNSDSQYLSKYHEYSHNYPCTPTREGRKIPIILIFANCLDVSGIYLQGFLRSFLLEREPECPILCSCVIQFLEAWRNKACHSRCKRRMQNTSSQVILCTSYACFQDWIESYSSHCCQFIITNIKVKYRIASIYTSSWIERALE